jgi:hypothetical protein
MPDRRSDMGGNAKGPRVHFPVEPYGRKGRGVIGSGSDIFHSQTKYSKTWRSSKRWSQSGSYIRTQPGRNQTDPSSPDPGILACCASHHLTMLRFPRVRFRLGSSGQAVQRK